jgi:hypothetical protein
MDIRKQFSPSQCAEMMDTKIVMMADSDNLVTG